MVVDEYLPRVTCVPLSNKASLSLDVDRQHGIKENLLRVHIVSYRDGESGVLRSTVIIMTRACRANSNPFEHLVQCSHRDIP